MQLKSRDDVRLNLTIEIETEQKKKKDKSKMNLCVTASKPDEFPKLKIFRDR